MKKVFVCMLALMMSLLAACGGDSDTNDSSMDGVTVDLTAFYEELAVAYEWGDSMADVEDEMLEGAYPGLSEVETEPAGC